ncbi:MAG: hypothetical protein ACRC37_06520 [Lentisphaeria bacterium]
MQLIFSGIVFLLAVLFAFFSFYLLTRVSETSTIHLRLPREKRFGIVIAFFCFIYAAWHGRYMLENDLAKFQVYVWFFVPFVTILMYRYLDFIFTRSFGGALVILTNHLMHDALVIHLPLRPMFALISYLLGTIGLFFIGMPWLFRNLLERIIASSSVRITVAVLCFITAIVYSTVAILAF